MFLPHPQVPRHICWFVGACQGLCRVFGLFWPVGAFFYPLLSAEMGQCLQYVPGMCLSARLWIGYCTGNHCLCYKKIAAAQTPLCMCGVCGCCISQFTHSGFHHRRAAVHSPLELNNVLFLINICSCTDDELYYILYLYGFEFCSRVYIFNLHFCVLQSYNKPRLDPNLHNFLLKNKAFGVDDCKAHHFCMPFLVHTIPL